MLLLLVTRLVGGGSSVWCDSGCDSDSESQSEYSSSSESDPLVLVLPLGVVSTLSLSESHHAVKSKDMRLL